MKITLTSLLLTIMALSGAIHSPVAAQAPYPNKAVRIVVPFSPGGGVDIYARLLATSMSAHLGQPIIVENDAGGAGVIALERVAKSAKDGYTLLVVSSTSISAAPNLYRKLPYKVDDFTPVALVGKFPFHVFVTPGIQVKDWKQFLTFVKSNPDKVSYATTGRGSTPHLVGEMVKAATGVDMADIPYKGSGPAFADLMGGHVQVYMDVPSPGLQHVQNGKLRVLAVLDENREAIAPDVPTMAELGYPGLTAFNRYTLLAPTGTPPEIIVQLNKAALAAMAKGPLSDKQIADGAKSDPATPDQVASMLKTDFETWGAVIRKLGIQLD